MATDTFSEADFSPWPASPRQQLLQGGDSRFSDVAALNPEASLSTELLEDTPPGHRVASSSPTERSEDINWPEHFSDSFSAVEGLFIGHQAISSPSRQYEDAPLGNHYAIFPTEPYTDAYSEPGTDSSSTEPNEDTLSGRYSNLSPIELYRNALAEQYALSLPKEYCDNSTLAEHSAVSLPTDHCADASTWHRGVVSLQNGHNAAACSSAAHRQLSFSKENRTSPRSSEAHNDSVASGHTLSDHYRRASADKEHHTVACESARHNSSFSKEQDPDSYSSEQSHGFIPAEHYAADISTAEYQNHQCYHHQQHQGQHQRQPNTTTSLTEHFLPSSASSLHRIDNPVYFTSGPGGAFRVGERHINDISLEQQQRQQHCTTLDQVTPPVNEEDATLFKDSDENVGVNAETQEEDQVCFPVEETDSSRMTTPSDLGGDGCGENELLPCSSHSDRKPDTCSASNVAGVSGASSQACVEAGGGRDRQHVQTPHAATSTAIGASVSVTPQRKDSGDFQPESNRRAVVNSVTGGSQPESKRRAIVNSVTNNSQPESKRRAIVNNVTNNSQPESKRRAVVNNVNNNSQPESKRRAVVKNNTGDSQSESNRRAVNNVTVESRPVPNRRAVVNNVTSDSQPVPNRRAVVNNITSDSQPVPNRRAVVNNVTSDSQPESNRRRGVVNSKGATSVSQGAALDRSPPEISKSGMKEADGEEDEEEDDEEMETRVEGGRKAVQQQQQKANLETARPTRRIVKKKTRKPKDKDRPRDKKGRGTEPSTTESTATTTTRGDSEDGLTQQQQRQTRPAETNRPHSADDRRGEGSKENDGDLARPHSSPSAAGCGFSVKDSVQTLVKLSEDLHFFKLFYLLHSPCRALMASKTLGPWCSRTGSKRSNGGNKQPAGGAGASCVVSGSGNALSSSTSSSSFPSKTLKEASSGAVAKERMSVERTPQGSVVVNNASNNNSRDRSSSLNAIKEVNGYTSFASSSPGKVDKNSNNNNNNATNKPGDVFHRLSGQVQPYVFRHLADVRRYMSEYREQYTVGRVGRKVRKVAVLGVDVVDPYNNATCRKKKSCTCKECCPPGQDKMAASPPNRDDATALQGASSGTPSGNENSSADKQQPARSVPNLAPVRESKISTSKVAKSQPLPSEPSGHTTSDPADLTSSSLVLPAIQSQPEVKRLSLVAQPAVAIRGPVTADKIDHTPALFTSYTSCSSLDESGPAKVGGSTFYEKEQEGSGGGAYSKRKKRSNGGRGIKLKYSMRNSAAATEATEVTKEPRQGSELTTSSSGVAQFFNRKDSPAGLGVASSGSFGRATTTAEAQEDPPTVSGVKIETAGSGAEIAEELASPSSATAASKEPLFPGIVRKGFTGEQLQRQPTFHKSLYTTFTLAKKIYAGKQEQQQQQHLMAESSSSRRFGSGELLPSLMSHKGIPNNPKHKRSRSVDVFPDSRVRVGSKDSWKSSLNSTDSSRRKGGSSLTVKVMSVDDIPTRLALEDGRDLYFPVLKQRRHPRLPPMKDSALRSSGATPAEEEEEEGSVTRVYGNHVMFFVPEASQPEATTQKKADNPRKKDGKSKTTSTDEGNERKGADCNDSVGVTASNEVSIATTPSNSDNNSNAGRPKLQNDFTPRPQRDKATSFSIFQKNGSGVSDTATKALVDSIGVRGKTIADSSLSEFTDSASRKETASSKSSEKETKPVDSSLLESTKKESAATATTTAKLLEKEKIIFNPGETRAVSKENLPLAQKPGFQGKLAALRQPTVLVAPVNGSGHRGNAKREVTSSFLRSGAASCATGADSLLVKGGSLEKEEAAKGSAADRKQALTEGNSHSTSDPLATLKVEYRLPKEAGPSLDKKEQVTAVR